MDSIMTSVDSGPLAAISRRTIGIVGAGVMGRGLAQAIAARRYQTTLVDVSEEILRHAVTEISTNLKSQALIRGDLAERPTEILSRISISTDMQAVADSYLVIENVSELTAVKREVYALLGRTVKPDTILAANTSTFPISEIAGFTTHPERVIGLHFMNPAQVKQVVEVIPGIRTSSQTLATALGFLDTIGKSGMVVADAPGFVSNRILMLTINEAIRTVEAQTASAADVDRIFVGCFGHTMGPLATADLIGLDTILLSLESLEARLGDKKYAPVALLKTMVGEKRLGRKTNRGFFIYGS
jgi:3-hydroxybutyryl-CoA dehydrogenase